MTKSNGETPSTKAPRGEAHATASGQASPEKSVGAARARLLRRKRLTGEELGRVLLLSLVHDFRRREATESAPLFTQNQLQLMVSRLPSDYERDIYQQYAAVYEQLVALFRQSQGLLQQLLHGLCRLSHRISVAEKVLLLQRRVSGLTGLDGDPALPGDIQAIFPDAFDGILSRPSLQAELRAARELMVLPSYAELAAYNAMLETLAEGLSLPELRELSAALQPILADAADYDAMLARCFATLPPEQSAALQSICLPLSLTSIQPDAEAMARFVVQLKTTGLDPEQLVQALRPDWQEATHG